MLTHAVSILFEADLPSVLKVRALSCIICAIQNLPGPSSPATTPEFGQLNVEYGPQTQSPRDFDPIRCARLVRTALGTPDLEVKVHDVLPWGMSALLASQFSQGRVFLVGDAAHLTPPVGGLGGQGGIQDAANLAWKLAFVIKGHAGPELLETYEAERKPAAHLAIASGIANYIDRMRPDRENLRIPGAQRII